MTIQLRELMRIEVHVLPLVDLGHGRRYVPFDGGTFESRHGWSGTVLPGGVDWQIVRTDGVIEIDAHYALGTEADETIEVRSTGIRKAAAAVADRIARGELVDPEEYYFRTHVRLTTSVPRLAWLNDLLAVSTGQRARDVVRIDVHEVL
jgi:Protein of unknown function (DUF3237)